ncbi:MAG: hypothetical protein M3010_02325 [Candidatus Dormibacteraeota bacterium]|nr:hypothetical protein [Candidatus Dormibacteraeota bacterium]
MREARMDRRRWSVLLKWAGVASGVVFCVYALATGDLAWALGGLTFVFIGVGLFLGQSLAANMDYFSSTGFGMFCAAALLEVIFPKSHGWTLLATVGAASFGLGLFLLWLAVRWGEPVVRPWLGTGATGRGDRAGILLLLALLVGALAVTLVVSGRDGWDGWLAIQGVAQLTALLLLARQLVRTWRRGR